MNLTPKCCSVHTHSVLCDGKGTLAEMAAAAYAAGVRFFGASCHSHTEIPHDACNVLPTDPAEYREQVLRLREEYAGQMEVLLGIEQDSRSAQPVPDWADYWIGSVHNLYDPKTGKWIIENHGVDPDILIDNDPVKEWNGEDQQLNRAIEEVMKQLKDRKPLPPVPAPRDFSK